MKPVWLLDIDGVINVDRKTAWTANSYTTGEADRFSITWSTDLVAAIQRLVAEDLVTVKWSTTWVHGESYKKFEALVGLGPFETAFSSLHDVWDTPKAKIEAADQHIREGVPTVWTDDEAIPQQFEKAMVDQYGADPLDFLLVEPDYTIGLTPDDLVAIEKRLRTWSSR